MANEIKNAFVEIVNRLDNACDTTGTGDYGTLEGALLVEGPTEQTFTDSQMPVIIYEILDGGFAEDAAFPDRARYKFTVLFTVMTKAISGYYDDDGEGIIDYLEKIMTVIDKNTSDTVDLGGAGTWGPETPQYKVGGFERNGLINTFLIEATFQTKRFGRGTLRS